MNRKPGLSDDLRKALTVARRSPGWNSRSRNVQRFDLDGCQLYVVPFRRWAYRRHELQAAAWWKTHSKEAEEARAAAAGGDGPPSSRY